MIHRRRITALLVCVAVAAVVLFYGFNDPATARVPRCLVKQITGFDCPGCGAQRAIHAMLHGDFAAAWRFNPALFFLVPVAAVYAVPELLGIRIPRLDSILYNRATLYIIVAAILLWWICRNIN